MSRRGAGPRGVPMRSESVNDMYPDQLWAHCELWALTGRNGVN